MTQWQRRLPLKDVWDSKDVPLIANTIAERLKALADFGDSGLDEQKVELAEEFAHLASDPLADADEFDDLMEQLYDWADTKLDDNWNGKKVCWVATF